MNNIGLSESEKKSLKELSKGLLQERIPLEHERKLLQLGLMEKKLGGSTLTAKGKLFLATNK